LKILSALPICRPSALGRAQIQPAPTYSGVFLDEIRQSLNIEAKTYFFLENQYID
jgi:hypothetical protein